MAQIKALFYLPLRDNDGRDLSEEIETLETELFVRFSGWTFQGYAKGAYRMADGTQSLDESAAYVVVCEDSRIDELERGIHDFKTKTFQEAMSLEIQRDVEVRFVEWSRVLSERVCRMNNQQTIEDQIRQTLASEQDAIVLSNRLFSPSGLFNQLATNEAERRSLAGTALFKEAQRRLSVLKRQRGRAFDSLKDFGRQTW